MAGRSGGHSVSAGSLVAARRRVVAPAGLALRATRHCRGVTEDDHQHHRHRQGFGQGNLLNPNNIAGIVDELAGGGRRHPGPRIVITGAGDVSCSGLDLSGIQAGGDPVEFATALVGLLRLIPTLGPPVVAAVNGNALASVASIVAAENYVVSTPTALIAPGGERRHTARWLKGADRAAHRRLPRDGERRVG